ncbi:MAG: CoA-binding protein [Ignavibacteriaceae bacterium]|nr:CoA-binding protein [Ignavibacteriaceae bacterium]
MELTCKILKESKTVAVVGISDKMERDSGRIAELLKRKGYNVVGVHPTLKEVFGIPVYVSLKDIPHKIDLVDVFLSSDKVPLIMNDVLEIKPKYLWFQLGVINDEAAKLAEQNGIPTVQNRCVAIELNYCK